MADGPIPRIGLCRDIVSLRERLARVPKDRARDAKILAQTRISSIRRVLLGRPGRTLADDLLTPSGATAALAEQLKNFDTLSEPDKQEVSAYVAGIMSIARVIASSEAGFGLRTQNEASILNTVSILNTETQAALYNIINVGYDAMVDEAINRGSNDVNRAVLSQALDEAQKLVSGVPITGIQDVDSNLAEKIKNQIAVVDQGRAKLQNIRDEFNTLVKQARGSAKQWHSEELEQQIAEIKKLYSEEASRVNELVSLLNEDEKKAHELIKAARDKLQEPLRNVGRMMIDDMVAASPVTSQQAMDWAKSQEITTTARNRLKKQGYQIEALLQDMAEFYRISGGRLNSVRINSTGARRASASFINDHGRVGTINIDGSFDRRTLWHELAHHLEADPVLKAAAGVHIRRRSEDGRAYTLRSLTRNKGYRSDETAYKDAFFNEYVGKIYRDGSTEVLSMCVESMSDPLMLAKRAAADPQTFELAIGMLKRPMSDLGKAHKALSAQILAMSVQGEDERKDDLRNLQDQLAEFGEEFVKGGDDGWAEERGVDWMVKSLKLTQIGRFENASNIRIFSGKVRGLETGRKVSGLVIGISNGQGFRSIDIPSSDLRFLKVAHGYFIKSGAWPYGRGELFNEANLRRVLENEN